MSRITEYNTYSAAVPPAASAATCTSTNAVGKSKGIKYNINIAPDKVRRVGGTGPVGIRPQSTEKQAATAELDWLPLDTAVDASTTTWDCDDETDLPMDEDLRLFRTKYMSMHIVEHIEDMKKYTCNCKAYMRTGMICSHTLAVMHICGRKLTGFIQQLSKPAKPGRPKGRPNALTPDDVY